MRITGAFWKSESSQKKTWGNPKEVLVWAQLGQGCHHFANDEYFHDSTHFFTSNDVLGFDGMIHHRKRGAVDQTNRGVDQSLAVQNEQAALIIITKGCDFLPLRNLDRRMNDRSKKAHVMKLCGSNIRTCQSSVFNITPAQLCQTSLFVKHRAGLGWRLPLRDTNPH